MQESLSRRAFVGIATGAVGAVSCSTGQPEAAALPNFVLCMGDDHGWHETGYNGHGYVQTPVLDEMAAAGLRLDRFYSAAPVCSPTRGSVMTGRHPNRYGTFSANWSIRPEEIGIARILSEAGYACGHFGKWHLGPVKAGSPTNPGAFGFEEWLSHDNFFELDPYLSHNGGPPERHVGESSQIVVEAATHFIGKAKAAGRPFFVVIWFGSPHEPYSGLEADLEPYSDLPPSLADVTTRMTSEETGGRAEFPLDKVLQARFAEITAMDRAIGDLRMQLRSEGLRDTTMLWYCSDNGAPSEGRFESPLRASKGTVYEGGLRVPSVIEWPGRIARPMWSGVHAVTSDILPTVCELAGRALPERPLDGISLVPLLDGLMSERPAPICFWRFEGNPEGTGEPYIDPELQEGTTPLVKKMDGRFTRNFRNFRYENFDNGDFAGPKAILGDRYKLVMDGEGAGADPVRELFDMREDPGETRDLASSEPATVEHLERELRQWQRSVLQSLTGTDYA